MTQAIFNAIGKPKVLTSTKIQFLGGPLFSIRSLTFTKTTASTSGTLDPTSPTGSIKAHDNADFNTLFGLASSMNTGDTLPLTIVFTTNPDGTLKVSSFSCGEVRRALARLEKLVNDISVTTEKINEHLSQTETAIVTELRQLNKVLMQIAMRLPLPGGHGPKGPGSDTVLSPSAKRGRRNSSPPPKFASNGS